jgi:hypothetical protein
MWLIEFLFDLKKLLPIVVLVIAAQGLHVIPNLQERWSPEPWTSTWFELKVPATLRDEPNLYLSVGMQSHTFLAPFFHHASRFVSVAGQTSVELDSPAGEKLRSLMNTHEGRIRVLTGVSASIADSAESRERFAGQLLNHLLRRLGMATDPAGCEVISSARSPGKVLNSRGELPVRTYYMMACALKPIPPDADFEKGRQEAKHIMNAVQETCARLLKPRSDAVDRVPGAFVRRFIGTEFDLLVTDAGQVYASQVRTPVDYRLGTRDDWVEGVRKDFPCPPRKRSSPWFDGNATNEPLSP